MNQNPPQRRQSLYCSQLPVVVIAAGIHFGGGTRGAFAPLGSWASHACSTFLCDKMHQEHSLGV